jgi:hypothetical protein
MIMKCRKDITEMNMDIAILEKAQNEQWQPTPKIPPVEGPQDTVPPC